MTGGIVTSRCPDNNSQAHDLVMWYALCSTVDRSISDKFLTVLLILLLSLSSHSAAERRRVKERFFRTHCTSLMLAAPDKTWATELR